MGRRIPSSTKQPPFYIFCKTQLPRHPAWGYSQNTTEGRKPLCCVHFTESPLAAGDNLVLTHLPDDARGNQPDIVNGIPLVDGGAADIVEFRAFPGQGRGRALAARKRGLEPLFPRLEGRAQGTSGPPGPTGFDLP